MKNIAILKRDSTKITISEFYERYNMGKYNLNPTYQRRGDVWDEEKQGFLIDTILKNYPIPPIFLHQRIDEENGSTMYDVIDGKQRLTAIVSFLKGELSLPQSYDEGAYGDSRLNGAKISDLENELFEYKKQLWRYTISVEYIDTDELDIIDSIFDRLNRNGEPLEMQELRRAKYHDTKLLCLVEETVKKIDWTNIGKIKINRMQDHEFASELVFFVLENDVSDGNSKTILDEKYKSWNDKLTDSVYREALKQIEMIVQYLADLKIDFNKYKIKGVSHFYALFVFCDKMLKKGIKAEQIVDKVNDFFTQVRIIDSQNENAIAYRVSMQSNTRSKIQRTRRIDALVKAVEVVE